MNVRDKRRATAAFEFSRKGERRRVTRCIMLVGVVAVMGITDASSAENQVSPTGRLLASNCSQCHGTNKAAAGFDALVGKPANKLMRELEKYQSGAEGEGIMTRHALGYTDQQLRDIAQWLSGQR